MLFYILMIATLNLGVGFAVAKFMGRGPRLPSREGMLEWARYLAWFAFDRMLHFQLPKRKKQTTPSEPAASAPPVAPVAGSPAPPVSSEPASAKPTEQIAPDRAEPAAEVDEETFVAAESSAHEPASSAVEEASVEDMMAGLMQFRDRIASLDTKVRKCAREPQTREVKQCVDEFKQANGEFLAKSEQISGQLVQAEADGQAQDEVLAKMKQAVETQACEVRQASQTLEHIDADGDPAAGCKAMLARSGSLIASSSKLKDELTETHIEIARQQGTPLESEELLRDELTQLPSRVALEEEIRQHLAAQDEAAPLAIALLDIDRLGELNGEYGAQIGDRLLHGAAQAMLKDLPQGATLGRFEGQRFGLLFAGKLANDVCPGVESLRQQLEAVKFRADGESLSITASCAVADFGEEEVLSEVLARLESALAEAKRFGRNRTFIHDGKSPAPVVPPEVSVHARALEI